MSARSTAHLAIDWFVPPLELESWEFFHHPAKQPFYQRHGLNWERLLQANERGRLVPYPRGPKLGEIQVLLSYSSYDDYLNYIVRAKRGYRNGYVQLERALQQEGTLQLPAATVLVAGGEALLFAGYRRLCLAWNLGMIPLVWRLDAE